ncbi:hypothetical protein CCZ01_08750 [Helicobacter monodelphidis]|nr:hypothetical protein CCZ01_08750 [Helicobacter sp. 15-1451]
MFNNLKLPTLREYPHFITTKLASIDTQRMEQDMDRVIKYSKKHNLYYITNQTTNITKTHLILV